MPALLWQTAASWTIGWPIPGSKHISAHASCRAKHANEQGDQVTCSLLGGHNARSLGEHAMGCVACAGKRTVRHDLVRDAIAATLRRHAEGRISVEVEPHW